MYKKLFVMLMALILTVGATAAVSASSELHHDGFGMDISYLEALSDDELLDFFAPFQAMVDELNELYGVDMLPPSLEIPEIRANAARTISTMTVDEYRIVILDFVDMLLSLNEWNAVQRAMWDAQDTAFEESDMELFEGLMEFQNIVFNDAQIVSQVYELIENDIEMSDILDIFDDQLYDAVFDEMLGIDPLQTPPQRTVTRSASTWHSSTTTIDARQIMNLSFNRWEFLPSSGVVSGTPRFSFPSQHMFIFSRHTVLSWGPNNQQLRVEFSGTHFAPGSSNSAFVFFPGTFNI